jgi:hemerythrin
MSSPTDTSPWTLVWTDELSVFIPEIDAEHRHFIKLINELNEAITRRLDLAQIKKCMQAILDDAVAHFDHEEALFRAWGYPDAQAHAQKHAAALLVISGIMAGLQHGGVEYEWIAACLKIKKTLIEHILTEDMKYRDFCLKNDKC